jgi:hypothetical protein
MNPWSTNPAWQNFSSLFREATDAQAAKAGIEKSHHLTASLYFGITALEAFLNQKMRSHLLASKPEEEIFQVLRQGEIMSKVNEWPSHLLGKSLALRPETVDLISFFNDVRGDLTHPKTHGHDIYGKLETVDPGSVIDAVAEYIVRFHEAQGTRFPYWLFGWNYLNPRQNIHEITLLNEQQFSLSLLALGFRIPAGAYQEAEAWRRRHLTSFESYTAIRQALGGLDRCEPKLDRFPLKPILCRRWWTAEHHRSCGHVTDQALDYARNHGA